MELFYGVITPKGKVEAVEMTDESALASARNLSPDPKHPNRTIEPVVVFRLETLIKELNAVDVDPMIKRARQMLHDENAEMHKFLRETTVPASQK